MEDNELLHRPTDVARLSMKAIEEARANAGREIMTYTALDEVIKLRQRKLTLMLGLSSGGKTFMLKHICLTNAEQIDWHGDEAMAFVTLEDAVEDLGLTDIANISRLSVTDILEGRADIEAIRAAAARRGAMPIYVIGHSVETRTRPKLSMLNIANALKSLTLPREQGGLGIRFRLVCIDYLQLIDRDTEEKELRMQFMENLNRAKNLAIELNTHVMMGAQAREDIANRKNKIPRMGDVHEAPAAGRHAPDTIISLWCPNATDEDGDSVEVKGETYTITPDLLFAYVAKNKQGKKGDVRALSVDWARGRVTGAYKSVNEPKHEADDFPEGAEFFSN